MRITTTLILAITALAAGNLAAESKPKATTIPPDPGWPRERTNEQGSLIYYQPQVDEWKDFKQLDFRMAFSLTPKGGKQIVGIMELQTQTDVNVDDHSVLLHDFKINEVKLPGLDAAKKAQMEQTVRSALFLAYLDRLNRLHERPEFYNQITDNCTTNIRLANITAEHGKVPPWNWRVLLNGKGDELLYERGVIDRSLPFAALKEQSLINKRARAADASADFSQLIRVGLPGVMPLP
jgi:hypothetical protein